MALLIRLVVATLLSTSFAATADRTSFSRFDVDRDGRLARWEVQQHARIAADFNTLDEDNSGYLSRRELLTAELSKPRKREDAL